MKRPRDRDAERRRHSGTLVGAAIPPFVSLWLAVAWGLFPVEGTAQVSPEMSRETFAVGDGLRLWKLGYYRNAFKQQFVILEVEGNSRSVTVRAALGGGLWTGESIDRIRERESALAAWQVLEQPFAGPGMAWPGLTVVEGTLVAGPGEGAALAITPDGFLDLIDSAPHRSGPIARLRTPAGLDLPIDWINQSATSDTLGLLADPGILRDGALAGIDRVTAAEVQFTARGPLLWALSAPNAGKGTTPWIASSQRESSWSAEPAYAPTQTGVFAPGWMGIVGVRGGAGTLTEALRERNSGTLQYSADPEWEDYRTVIPLRGWLVHKGRILVSAVVPEGDPRGERKARAAVGISPEENRLWLAIALDRDRYAEGVTEYELAELMLALGATEAALGPEGDAVGASVENHQVLPAGRVPARCRLALVIAAASPPGDDDWVDVSTRTQLTVSGTPSVDWRTTADRVIDRRQGIRPTLDHFWASNGTADLVPTLTFDLRREFVIGQVDFAHAEDAGFSPDLDAREIRISYRPKGQEQWVSAATVTNDPPRRRQHVLLDPPVPAQTLRFEFTKPNALTENPTARMVEIVLWGQPGR